MKISSIHFLMALAMLLPGITAFADNAVIEVNYEIHQRLYVEDEELATDQMVLLIGENSSIFKSATAELRRQQRDSIAKATINQMGLPIQGGMMMGSVAQTVGDDSYQVLKNLPKQGQLTLIDGVGGKNYIVEETMPAIEWSLVEGDSIIAEYACQKATGQWRGREWIVWYTVDLPYDDGPWKLCGLPGLILSAHDSSDEFTFDCISIKKGNGKPLETSTKGEKCSLKQLQSMKTRSAKDPIGFVLESMGLGDVLGSGNVQVITMSGDSGQKAEVPSRTPVFMEQP